MICFTRSWALLPNCGFNIHCLVAALLIGFVALATVIAIMVLLGLSILWSS